MRTKLVMPDRRGLARGWFLSALRPLIVLVVLFAAVVSFAADSREKPILVHYMPWFVGKPGNSTWGWHWTMNACNPETTNSAGQAQIAAVQHPQIGPYDSAAPAVLEYHVLLMKLAGVDGVIVDWYGPDDYNDYAAINARAQALLQQTRKAGLKFCLCYEDRSIEAEIKGGRFPASNAVTHASQVMLSAQTNFFADSSYLRRPDRRPVLLNFGPSYFKSNDDWRSIFSVLEPTNRPAFFMLDQRLPIAEGGYDWPPMHLGQTNGGVLTQKALEDYLDHFEASARSWPASISSAFPRFQDYYRQAGVGPSLGSLDDADGNTFRFTLTRALTNHSAMVQIVTWNDFGEGTVVEPTAEYGYRDLGVIQDLRRKHLDPAFPYHAEDFALALKFYQLRRKHEGSARASAKLDEVFAQVVSGELKSARAGIKALDAPELSEAQPPTGR